MFLCFLCEQRGNEVNSEFWKDMVAAIDHNYNTSAFKGMYFIQNICDGLQKLWIRLCSVIY